MILTHAQADIVCFQVHIFVKTKYEIIIYYYFLLIIV